MNVVEAEGCDDIVYGIASVYRAVDVVVASKINVAARSFEDRLHVEFQVNAGHFFGFYVCVAVEVEANLSDVICEGRCAIYFLPSTKVVDNGVGRILVNGFTESATHGYVGLSFELKGYVAGVPVPEHTISGWI